MKQLLTASFVATMDGPVIRDGGVVVDRQILAVGKAEPLRRQYPDAAVIDLPGQALLPGLVNPHAHLELSNCSCDPASASFTDWVLSLPSRLGRDRLSPEEVFPAATRAGIEQCLRFGVTCVGDISQQMHLTRPVLAASPLRCVSYGEVLGLGKLKPRFEELFPRAVDTAGETGRLTVGLSPHAPYTVDLPGYERCVQIATGRGLPLATHLAELPYEQDFLEHRSGPFRQLWDSLGHWNDAVQTYRGSPVRFAHAVGLLAYPTLLAHVNYCDDDDLRLLASGTASVVYCPRTHTYFGHPPHRFREMRSAGVNVAVGTDSCASSPDLNVLDDLRLVRRLHPDLSAESLFAMVTTNAARALQMEKRIGSLAAGKEADFVSFTVRTDDPLTEILDRRLLPDRVWIDGEFTSRSAPGR